jgi:hypothetical protein
MGCPYEVINRGVMRDGRAALASSRAADGHEQVPEAERRDRLPAAVVGGGANL